MKLEKNKNINTAVKIICVLSFSLFKAIESCFFISSKINLIMTLFREGKENILTQKKIIEKIIISQFISSKIINCMEDLGSNDRKSLIFIIFFLLLSVFISFTFLNSKNIYDKVIIREKIRIVDKINKFI